MADNEVFRFLGGLREYLFQAHVRIVLILGVLASPNHPPWGYVGATGPGAFFWILPPMTVKDLGGWSGDPFLKVFQVKTIQNVKLSSLLGSWLQDGPKMVQRRSKMASDGPEMAPRWPKKVQEGPKMVPRWPQDGPR
jgi:predicted lysophospholipase L1 biosynthesis ABC-type transport system permease subunit